MLNFFSESKFVLNDIVQWIRGMMLDNSDKKLSPNILAFDSINRQPPLSGKITGI